MPEIAVIVPVYEVESYLHQCVDSILAQTYRNFELILVDDGSPDHCGDICEEYARLDGRVVVLHQVNGGRSSARNAGLDWVRDHSKAKWIAFVDGDDWVHPEILQSLLAAVNASGCRVSVCGFDREATANKAHDELCAKAQYEVLEADDFSAWCYDIEDYRFMLPDVVWGKLYDRELFAVLRYPEECQAHEDTFTTYRAIFAAGRIAVTAAPFYHYSCNPNSIMSAVWDPQWLNVLAANREQIRFFSNKYPKAHEIGMRTFLYHVARLHAFARAAGDKAAQRRIRSDFWRFMIEHWRWVFALAKTSRNTYVVFIPGLRWARWIWRRIHHRLGD